MIPSRSSFSRLITIFLLPLSLLLQGCSGSTATDINGYNPTFSQNQSGSQQIVAMVDAQPIRSQELWPLLAEASGTLILEEYLLTQLLDTKAKQQDLNISLDDIQHELNALVDTIQESSSPQNTARLITTIRTRRGLGPQRFDALLRRNAILRRLIQNDPALDASIDQEIAAALQSQRVEGVLDTRGTERITRRARLVAEQRAMEQLARSLVDGIDLLIMDRSLKWSGE